jgi:uncharacterized protein (TIGR02452 family)
MHLTQDKRNYLIDVFYDTCELSKHTFGKELAVSIENTKVIEDGSSLLVDYKTKPQKIEVVGRGTIQYVIGVSSSAGRIAILNFADPYKAGGEVFDGEDTQEEDICRCTTLYETLIKDECRKGYYKANTLEYEYGIFSDRLIYSPDVIVLKDEHYELTPCFPKVDVITCPAPIDCDDIYIFESRIKCIIGAAYSRGINTLVLGAWGCGAFGNNPEIVSQAFKNMITEYPVFDNVVFAIRNTRRKPDSNYEVFKRVIQG